MRSLRALEKIGTGYDIPGASDAYLRAHQCSRWGTVPNQMFRAQHGWGMIFVNSAKNAGDPRAQLGATKNAAEIAHDANFIKGRWTVH